MSIVHLCQKKNYCEAIYLTNIVPLIILKVKLKLSYEPVITLLPSSTEVLPLMRYMAQNETYIESNYVNKGTGDKSAEKKIDKYASN